MHNLPANSFAAMVYWVFVVGIIMILSNFIYITLTINKKWLAAILLCPPLSILFIKKYWQETQASCFFAIGFYCIIIAAGSISGYKMVEETNRILQYIFLWPYQVANILIK